MLLDSLIVDRNFKDCYGRTHLEYSALRLSTQIIRLLFNSDMICPMSEGVDLNRRRLGWSESAAEYRCL